MKKIGLLLTLIAGPSWAQSTTDCTRDYFGNVHCTTQPNSGVDWSILHPPPVQNPGQGFANGYAQGQGIGGMLAQDRANHEAKKVGKLLARGDCAGAEQYALKAGRFDLAEQARAYCPK